MAENPEERATCVTRSTIHCLVSVVAVQEALAETIRNIFFSAQFEDKTNQAAGG